jgi:sarcosine oxidase subunit gamma
VSHGAITIAEDPGVAIASLAARRNDDGRVRAAVAELTGAPPPGPGRIAGAGEVEALWSGQGQWLLLAPYAGDAILADRVKNIVGTAGSVTEQSDGWVCFRLTGEGVVDLMERICMLDVATAVPGFATRTVLHHVSAFVIRDADGWRVLGPRSAAGSLLQTMEVVAAGLAARAAS